MGFLETDQDYLDAGVDPPEHIPHPGSESVPFDNHIHRWTAVGSHIECDGGHHIHGQGYDHMKYQLVGTSKEGHPVFKPIKLANQDEVDKLALMADDGNNGDARTK